MHLTDAVMGAEGLAKPVHLLSVASVENCQLFSGYPTYAR